MAHTHIPSPIFLQIFLMEILSLYVPAGEVERNEGYTVRLGIADETLEEVPEVQVQRRGVQLQEVHIAEAGRMKSTD